MHFSTDALPERDRLPYWVEEFGRVILRLDVAPVDGRPFRETASIVALDGLGIVLCESNGQLCRRSRPLLADGNDDLLFCAIRSGMSLPSQVGRDCRLDAGDGVLMSTADVGSYVFPGPARGFVLRIPRAALRTLVANPESALIRPIPGNTEALRLLVDYVSLTVEKHRLGTSQLRKLFTTHIHDLVALAIGATRDAREIAQSRGLRAARLDAVKSDIIDHLGDEGLSVADLARRHRVTPRYVHMLFEAEGRTFSEYVVEQRLAHAHRMLTDARFAGRTVSAIAFEVGFGNLSYFNRVFRRRYGATPSDVREAAWRQNRG
jgi:AraC-like DNA-binding protein